MSTSNSLVRITGMQLYYTYLSHYHQPIALDHVMRLADLVYQSL